MQKSEAMKPTPNQNAPTVLLTRRANVASPFRNFVTDKLM